MSSHVPKYVAWIAGATTAALGLAVLAGWYFQILPVIQVASSQAAMQPMTAWSFLLCGIAVILLSTGHRRSAGILTAIPFLVSILVLLEYLLTINLGIDALFGKAYITAHISNIGRMSPLTAVCFLIVAASLVTASLALVKYASAALGIAGSVIAMMGSVSTFGYLIGQTDAYSWGNFTRVPVNTAAGFILLGAGLIAVAWREKPMTEKLPRWFPLSVGIATAAGTLGLWQALVAWETSQLELLSDIMLFAGFLLAFLLAMAIHFAQRAWTRSQELHASQETFEQLFEAAPDGILASDFEGRIVQVNSATEQLFGYSRAELLGQPVEILIPERFRQTHDEHRRQYHLNPQRRPMGAGVELYGKHKNGSQFPIDIMLSPLESRNGLRVLSVVRDITQRKQAEAELRIASELITHMEQGVCLTRASDGVIVHANPKFEAMFSYGPGELAGKEVSIVNAPTDVSPKETARKIMAALKVRGTWAGELLNRRKDGTTFWCAVTTSTFEHSDFGTVWVSVHKDITERKQAEFQLRTLTDRLGLATKIASMGVWEWELRNNTLIWNDLMYEIYGIEKNPTLVYESWRATVHADDRPKVEAWLQRVIHDKVQEGHEFRIVRPDGSVRYIHAVCQVILSETQEVLRVIGLNSDITERRLAEAQLESNRVQLISSARLASLGMMAGGVAHEINNPLSIIHASADNLLFTIRQEGSVSQAVVVRNAERILKTANRISKIVQSLRHLARDSSQDRFSSTPVIRIVDEALEICKENFKDNSIRLLLPQIDPELRVSCREVQIAQVLLNLLQNAFDAVMEQPSARWIRLALTVHDDSVTFSVIDNGPGIPSEIKQHIMEPFFTTKSVGKGTGLGLSLSRSIVEEHGGKLELTEDSDHTCFSFHIPLANTEALCI